MKAHEFCYWLQGLFELVDPPSIDSEQTALIKQHLAMVFIHDIDPKYPADQQKALNEAHAKPKPKPQIGGVGPDGTVFRC